MHMKRIIRKHLHCIKCEDIYIYIAYQKWEDITNQTNWYKYRQIIIINKGSWNNKIYYN